MKNVHANGMSREESDSWKNHLAHILQSLGEGVIVADGNMRIVLMNVKAMEYLDYIPAEDETVISGGLFRYCTDGMPELLSMINAESTEELEADIMIQGPRAKDRYLRVKKNSLVNLLPGSSETILLFQDITREKELDRLKNEFISNLSHELRTPMNAVIGISKMLKSKNSSNLTSTQTQGLEMIHESGIRLLSLINDILDLSKIEAGRMEIQKNPFRMDVMIRYLTDVASSLVKGDSVRFLCDVDRSVPDVVVTDEERLRQVLVNLLGNSFKFTEKGEVALKIRYEEDRLFFSVSDTGIGIAAKDLPLIFERFKQADGSMSRRFQGTGLGLALCREMVELLGGEIGAESVKGSGTTVSFYIPYTEDIIASYDIVPEAGTEKIHPEREIDHARDQEHAVILIVEDEETGRETLRLILEDDYELHFSENGSDVLEQIERWKPDVVLMDLMMPVVDGYQALSIIRASQGGRRMPVIAVTARAMKGEKERILNYGFNGYISKPVNDYELLETISMALESKRERILHETEENR